MYNLVYEKRNDIFTDSMIIAKHSENQHESIKRQITEYEKQFLELGTLPILNRESTGGRPEQYYELNEMQASFLLTLLRNSKQVVAYKLALVKEFYRMRQALMERCSSDWLQTREKGKLVRREETDAIKALVPYAEAQGSKNSKMYYKSYSTMVNIAVGIESGMRDKVSYKTLMLIALLEDTISNTILEEMQKGVYYKEIYRICKGKVEQFVRLTYLKVIS